MVNENDLCIVSKQFYNIHEIKDMGVDAFMQLVSSNLPNKLYKYFPNTTCIDKNSGEKVNYSNISLRNNTVHVSNPQTFDDIFDSNIYCDKEEFIKYRLMAYCKRCNVMFAAEMGIQELSMRLAHKFKSYYDIKGNVDCLLSSPLSVVQEKSDISFLLKIRINLDKYRDWQDAIINAVESQYNNCLSFINQQFNIACFSTTPFSTLMWGGSYGNCHNGFCVEYTLDQETKDNGGFNISQYLMPMVYCKQRPNIAKILSENEDRTPNPQWLWNILVNGVLCKDISWSFQDEWRLWAVNGAVNRIDDNVKFYPITKVFLGYRMNKHDRNKIANICSKLNIPIVGIRMKMSEFKLEEYDL